MKLTLNNIYLYKPNHLRNENYIYKQWAVFRKQCNDQYESMWALDWVLISLLIYKSESESYLIFFASINIRLKSKFLDWLLRWVRELVRCKRPNSTSSRTYHDPSCLKCVGENDQIQQGLRVVGGLVKTKNAGKFHVEKDTK